MKIETKEVPTEMYTLCLTGAELATLEMLITYAKDTPVKSHWHAGTHRFMTEFLKLTEETLD